MTSIPPGYGQHRPEGFGGAPDTSSRDAEANAEPPVARAYHGHSASFSAPRRSTYHSSTPSDATQVSSVSSDTGLEPLAGQPRASTFSVRRKPLPAVSDGATSKEARDMAPSTPFLGGRPQDPTTPSGINHSTLRWRPFYLRRSVLVAFAILFALLIGVAQGLLAHSKAASGLGDPEDSSRYLWQFGGTAVMTLVMALWARVEYQIKVAAPWIRLSRGPSDPTKTLLVDYVSDFQPVAIVKAFRYGDYLVGFISLVSILLRVLIIASTAVISPSFIGVVKPETSVTLQNSFVNNADPLLNVGSMPHFSMAGLVVNNLTYPDGTSKTHSYQPFSASRGSSSAEVEVTVDGLANSLDCEPADIALDGLKYIKSQWTAANFTVSLEDCDYELKLMNQGMRTNSDNDTYRFFFMPQGCNGSDEPDDMRIVVGFTQIEWDADSFPSEPWASNEFVNGSIGRTMQLVCKPNYTVTDVLVVKNGTELVSIEETGGDMRTLSNVHPADIMAAHFESYPGGGTSSDGGPYEDPSYWLDAGYSLEADMSMTAAIRYRMLDTNKSPQADELLDPGYLTNLVQDYYKQFTVFITRRSLMEEASVPATGRSTTNRDRLMARSLPVHLITGLLVPCLLITVAATFFVPKRGILPQAPTSLINVAALLASSTPLLQTLRGTGPVDTATLRQRLLGSQYFTSVGSHDRAATDHTDGTMSGGFRIHGGHPDQHSAAPAPKKWVRPPTLNFASRAAGLFITIGMIATLEILLRKSRSGNGIADVRSDDNSIFWTTALPATLLGLLAFYYSIADNTIRTLSPFVKLKHGEPFRQTVALDLLDKSRPRIVWSAAMASEFAVLSSTMAVLIASTLTIFSSSLYRPVPVPVAADASIPAMDYFAASDMMAYARDSGCTQCNAESVTASLILGSNLTYPPFTYEDLAFQTLDTNATDRMFPEEGEASMQEMVVSMTLPALRSRLSCRVYSPDDIMANLTLGGYNISGGVNPLRLDTPAEACGNDGDEDSNAVIPTAYSPDAYGDLRRTGFAGDVVFGIARSDPRIGHCSEWFYAWGSLADANSNDTVVTNVGAMGCNETMEVVDVGVELYGPELDFDPAHPPEVDESSAREVVPDYEDPLTYLLYPWLANATSPEIVDQFFSLLISSRYAVPVSSLGEASAAEEVSAAIRKQHGIIRAQDMNFNRRMGLTEDDAFPARNLTDDDGNTQSKDAVSAFGADLSPEEAVPSIQGRATSRNVLSHRRRVVQDGPTTRVLQALLSLILAFAVLSWIFTRNDRVPRSDAPLSIASMGSLLVDGDVLGRLPRGAEWMRGRDVEQLFKEDGVPMAFFMGWEGETKKGGLFSKTSFASFGSGKKGAERAREGSVTSDGYSSAYGSGERYGIRVCRDEVGEGPGVWGWLRGRRGYVRGRVSES